jgi:hypothetical protein
MRREHEIIYANVKKLLRVRREEKKKESSAGGAECRTHGVEQQKDSTQE